MRAHKHLENLRKLFIAHFCKRARLSAQRRHDALPELLVAALRSHLPLVLESSHYI